jgi:hypothetical protein
LSTLVSSFLWILELTIFFLHVRCIVSSRFTHTAGPTHFLQFSGSIILHSRGTIHARLYRTTHALFRVHIYLQSVLRHCVWHYATSYIKFSATNNFQNLKRKFYEGTTSFPLFNNCFNIMVVVVSIAKAANGFSCFQFLFLKLDNSHVQATLPFNILSVICDKGLTIYKSNCLVM